MVSEALLWSPEKPTIGKKPMLLFHVLVAEQSMPFFKR